MYNALDIARYIVNYSWDIGRPVNNTRLQKILYFVQGGFIQNCEKLCFDDDFECWSYGPSIPLVYECFRIYGMSFIDKISTIPVFDFEDEKILVDKPIDFSFLDEADKQLINGIVQATTKFSTTQLVSISQNQDPWLIAKTTNSKIIDKTSLIFQFSNNPFHVMDKVFCYEEE